MLNRKVDIEIDGNQHRDDKRIAESDKRRNQYLLELGWTVVRIFWSDYCKLSFDQKKIFVKNIIHGISSVSVVKDISYGSPKAESRVELSAETPIIAPVVK